VAWLYRQLTVGITEGYLQQIYKTFSRFDDVSASVNINVAFVC
jgi:hypothetical protein